MTWASKIYTGSVMHRRFAEVHHEFRYSLFMLWLDLDELPSLFEKRWFWSLERWNVVSFRRRHYMQGDSSLSLVEVVRQRVASVTGRRPDGPVRLLTHPSFFGFCFNPVSFYWCFDASGQVEAVVAEITNTPWQERHSYVLSPANPQMDGAWRHGRGTFTFNKDFHVSPFFPLAMSYTWVIGTPGDQLEIYMRNDPLSVAGDPVHEVTSQREIGLKAASRDKAFEARLSLQAMPWTGRSLAVVLLKWPFMTFKVVAGIYLQALYLWLKKVTFYPHPRVNAYARQDR
jgi:DUF1365 family protein